MKTVRFNVRSHYVGGANNSETVEYNDDVTEEQIEEDFRIWLEDHTTQDAWWDDDDDRDDEIE